MMTGGIILRVAYRFQQRFVEWLAAFQIMFMGLVLLHPGDTFHTSPVYSVLQGIASENEWGVAMFIVGLSRLIGLIVNGARQDVTPWIRAAGAVAGFFIFGVIALGVFAPWYNGAPPTPGLAMFPPAMVAELVAFYFSLKDAKAYRDGRKRTA